MIGLSKHLIGRKHGGIICNGSITINPDITKYPTENTSVSVNFTLEMPPTDQWVIQTGSKITFTFGGTTKEFTIDTINTGQDGSSAGGMMGGMVPYSEAGGYAGGYSGNYAGGMGGMTGMGQYGQYDPYGQYGQSTAGLWSSPLQDSMFIESIGRTIAWNCTVWYNNPQYDGVADGTIKGTVSSYTSNVAPIEEDIVITCNFTNFAWYQTQEANGISGTWTSDSELLGKNGIINWPNPRRETITSGNVWICKIK